MEEVAILYFYNILKDTIERKRFKNCPLKAQIRVDPYFSNTVPKHRYWSTRIFQIRVDQYRCFGTVWYTLVSPDEDVLQEAQ